MPMADKIYNKIANDDDSPVCEDVDNSACTHRQLSFVLILLSSSLTKLGDAIASPKTTLAWVATAVGTPAFILGFLVPVRESGSMIPQIFIGARVRRLALRKWVWVAGSIIQCLAVAGMGLVVFWLQGAAAGWALLGLVAVFSLARAFSSVASKDVVGKTIPKPRRGRLSGWAASFAGLVTVGVGLVLINPGALALEGNWLGILLILAGGLWLVAAAIYSRVPEPRGETGGARSAREALAKLSLLRDDRPFRRFVMTRALLMCSALSAPFYVALAQDAYGSPAYLLGAFIAASGAASLLSSPFWGRFADASSKSVMIIAALITSGIGIVTVLCAWFAPALISTAWFLPLGFFLLNVAHAGVRVGRKTYVVNLGGGNKRTDYVSISNSVIGMLLLLVGSVGALAPIITQAGVIGLLALMGLAGALLGRTLPQVE